MNLERHNKGTPLLCAWPLLVALAGCQGQSSRDEVQTCQPGSIAACLGADGCQGGQTCRPDGSGFDACDCSAGSSPFAADPNCVETDSTHCSLSERCCPGAACVSEGEVMVCRARCESGSDCETGCCTPWDNATSVCSPAERCTPAQSCRVAADCATACCSAFSCAPSSVCASNNLPPVVGFSLYGDDGAYLGVATSDPSVSDGACNPSGPYGNTTSATSIFNPSGTYGSPSASLSAYNPNSFTPPFLYAASADEYLAEVSKNMALFPVIDPDQLCIFLAQNGL